MAQLQYAVLLAGLMTMVLCQEHHHHEMPHEEHHVEEHHHAHPKYEFKYGVKDTHTHDIKEQHEKRDGHKVEGYYKLLEADGTTRTVHYTADKHTGFHAHVEREGHAVHPIHETHHHEKSIEVPHGEEEVSYHEPSFHSSFSNNHH